MITPDNISSHELIGLQAQLVMYNNKQMIGFDGKIIDETKFMFVMRTRNGIKRLAKNIGRWKIELDGKEIELDGSKLIRRSYERVGDKQ